MDVLSYFADQWMGSEFKYLIVVFLLFIVPRLVARFGIPLAITSFLIGLGLQLAGVESLSHDVTLKMLSIIGISSLFLYAGLEVDLGELRDGFRGLLEHIVIQGVLLYLIYLVLEYFTGYSISQSLLMALLLLTPSTGFILDSLPKYNLDKKQIFWIKNKAITAEIVALGFLFFANQSASMTRLFTASISLAFVLLILPFLLGATYRYLSKYAPQSEFGYLILLSVAVGIITKKLGAYYLVGAFVVGLVAGRLGSTKTPFNAKGTLVSVKNLTSIFIPFYFFSAGLGVRSDMLTFRSFLLALLLFVVIMFAKIVSVSLHRKVRLRESFADSSVVAISLLPNLVFGLVIAEILRQNGEVSDFWMGALILYTLMISIIPAFILKWMGKEKSSDSNKDHSEADAEPRALPSPVYETTGTTVESTVESNE